METTLKSLSGSVLFFEEQLRGILTHLNTSIDKKNKNIPLSSDLVEFVSKLGISKKIIEELIVEVEKFRICLVNVSEKYLPCVNNLVKEHKEAKNLKDPAQLEFVRQILLKDLIPHFKKIYREFLDFPKINDVDVRFADLYIKNLKEQISLLR